MKTEVGPEMLFKDRLGMLNIGLKFIYHRWHPKLYPDWLVQSTKNIKSSTPELCHDRLPLAWVGQLNPKLM